MVGVVETLGLTYRARAVPITTGTFLNGLIHIGECRIRAGRAGEFAATGLAACLHDLGFKMGRLKTGTPPRLAAGSIDFAGMDMLGGDPTAPPLLLAHHAAAPGAGELLRHPHHRRHP